MRPPRQLAAKKFSVSPPNSLKGWLSFFAVPSVSAPLRSPHDTGGGRLDAAERTPLLPFPDLPMQRLVSFAGS
jgi:hypothetical protein